MMEYSSKLKNLIEFINFITIGMKQQNLNEKYVI
jgi:hypothetical protein